MSRVGQNIKEARSKANLSQKQLAKKVGVSESFIKDVELGKKIVNETTMNKFSKVLGKELNDITMSFEEEVLNEDVGVNKSSRSVATPKVSEVWNDAFSSLLKTIPVYGYDLAKPSKGRQMPIVNNKIEGYSKDKVLFLKIEKDDMIGFRIAEGDIAFGHITHEIENNAICLIEYNETRTLRQIKRIDNSKLLLISNKGSIRTETVTHKDIKVLVRLDRVEVTLP